MGILMPMEHRALRVDDLGQRRIFTWIDLNVPYYGTSESNHYELTGCRQMVPSNLESVLADVARRRCASCHGDPAGIPRDPYVRITNIRHNSFLMAPLAEVAGGSQRCSKPVFASQDDPDYRAIVETFQSIDTLLQQGPRMDMVDSTPCPSGICPAETQ